MDKKTALKIAIAALLFTMVASVVHGISTSMTIHYYTDPAYAGLWSSVLPINGGFSPLSLFVNFVIGALFANAFLIIKGSLAGGNYLKKGMNFGLLLFMIWTLPFALTLLVTFNVPAILLIFWILLDGFFLNIIAGLIISRIVG